MASDDIFDIDGMQGDIQQMLKKLDKIEGTTQSGEVMNTAMQAAADVLQAEEKRILSQNPKYAHYQAWLSTKTRKDSKGHFLAEAGYDSDTITAHKEVVIAEFGRPGKRHKNGIDKRGRKIGAVQPYSHIRAALVTKRDVAKKAVADVLFAAIEDKWGGNR